MMLLNLLLTMVAIATSDIPVFSQTAEEDCMNPFFLERTGDVPLSARTRYLTTRHYWFGGHGEPVMLDPGEAIVVVDVIVLGTPDGQCRLDCSSWRCRYAVEVGCWHYTGWPLMWYMFQCKVNHTVSVDDGYPSAPDYPGGEYVYCVDGYRWSAVESAHRIYGDDEG